MFNLDIAIFKFIYSNCLSLGCALGYGALEGFITYFIIIAGSTLAVIEKRRGKIWLQRH